MEWPFKWNLSTCTYTWCYLFFKISQNEIWDFCRILPLATFGSERVKTSHEGMSRRSRAATTKKVRQVCCTCKVVLCSFLTFSLPSPSSHLNVPFQGKEDGNNIRVVLITLKLFLFCRKIGKKILMRKKPQNQNPKKKVRTRLKQGIIRMVMITMRMMWNLRRKVKCINSCRCRHTTHCNYVLRNK